jgi:transposase
MNRVQELTDEEIEAVRRLHHETSDADVRSRCDVILRYNEGLSPPQIAQLVRFSRRTVTRCIQRYEAEGLLGLFTASRPGQPRRVTTEYEAQLLQAVAQEPHSLGLPFSHRRLPS